MKTLGRILFGRIGSRAIWFAAGATTLLKLDNVILRYVAGYLVALYFVGLIASAIWEVLFAAGVRAAGMTRRSG